MRQIIKTKNDALNFGKYRDATIHHVLINEASYILWLNEKEICQFPEDIIIEAEELSEEQHLDWLRDNYEDDRPD